MGNNRVYYGCLGAALAAPNSFPSTLLPGVQSVGVSSQSNNEYIIPIGSKNPAIVYSKGPDISFTYTEAFDTLQELTAIDGCNDFIDLFMFVGEDDEECMDARKYIRCRYLLLESVTYSLAVDGIFTCEKSYKGFSRYICSGQAITMPGCGSETSSGVVGSRKNFNISSSSLPSVISQNTLQSISLKYSINREAINEPGTRTPYGFMTRFPIETSCTFELLSRDLDSGTQDFADSSCSGLTLSSSSFTIATCGINGNNSSITIDNANLSSISYNGGDATGSNQTISAEFITYQDPGINALVEFVNDPTRGC